MGSMAFILAEKHPLAIKVQSLDNRRVKMDIPIPDRVFAYTAAQSLFFERINIV